MPRMYRQQIRGQMVKVEQLVILHFFDFIEKEVEGGSVGLEFAQGEGGPVNPREETQGSVIKSVGHDYNDLNHELRFEI